ncbi:hypothetical protein HanIR_Chr15g0734861 [Helianthus annuus]|nr:hypothetical protein HanIR_Chr15g0734861 [Helianthus annuus]
MSAHENLNRTKSPSKHLVQPVGQIDRCRPLECGPFWHTVNRFPSSTMHLESCQDIFCDRSVNPSNLSKKGVRRQVNRYSVKKKKCQMGQTN